MTMLEPYIASLVSKITQMVRPNPWNLLVAPTNLQQNPPIMPEVWIAASSQAYPDELSLLLSLLLMLPLGDLQPKDGEEIQGTLKWGMLQMSKPL